MRQRNVRSAGTAHARETTSKFVAAADTRLVDSMIDRVIGNGFIPVSIRQDIIERSDGIPLFVEEITKAVLEAETPDEAARTAAALPHPPLLPSHQVCASLMARLDRLGPAKEVAQIGAAIGREFSIKVMGIARRNEHGPAVARSG